MGRTWSRISGTGHALPERVLTNLDLEKMVDTTDEWIATRTGIRERRVAAESEYLSLFAAEAGRRALQMAGLSAEELDLIIVATVTQDQPIPSTACFVQAALGAPNAAAFDMAAGCSGFIYALAAADGFLRTGAAKHALVIGGEILSKFLDWTDRATCVLFGDGAGAVILSAGPGPSGLLSTAIHADGTMADFITLPGGGSRVPVSHAMINANLHTIKMKGNETFKIAVRSLESVCREAIERASLSPADVRWFVPHQANTRIIHAVTDRLGWPPETLYLNIDRIGNTSAASIPIALDELVRSGRVAEGDVLLFAAFGAGLTWGSALVRW
ncbi:MAG: beta-ketoacyl-ACP synthase III [Acidobacteriota bacterium]